MKKGKKKNVQQTTSNAQLSTGKELSKDEALVVSIAEARTIEERGKVIRQHFFDAKAHVEIGAMHALQAGVELCAVKSELKHGQWLDWVKDNCPFSEDTAQKYMQAAIRRAGQLANTERARYLLPEKPVEAFTEEERKRLTEALQASSEGVSIRQLYLDLGMTSSDPNKQTPKLLGDGKANPLAELEFHKGQAIEVFNAILIPLGKYILEKGKAADNFLNLLDQAQYETLRKALEEAAERMVEWKK